MNENSREFALLNPSGVAQRQDGKRAKVAADEDDSDGSSEDDDESEGSEKDESDRAEEEELRQQISRRQHKAERPPARHSNVRMVDAAPRVDGRNRNGAIAARDATFGQRKQTASSNSSKINRTSNKPDKNMAMEYTWIPEASGEEERDASQSSKSGGKEKRPGVEYFGSGMERGGGGNATSRGDGRE